MAVVVTECGLVVGGSTHNSRTRSRADDSTDALVGGDVLVPGARRDIGSAFKLPTVELVDKDALETIGHWVDVTDPVGPASHVIDWDRKAGVYDECKQDDRSWSQGLGNRLCERREEPEEHGHAHHRGESDEQEEEERSRFPTQIRHEIYGRIDDDAVQDFVWEAHDGRGECFGAGVVQGVTTVLLDHGPLRVESEDLEDARKGVQNDGHEDDGATGEEARSVARQIVEDAADDEGLEEVCSQHGYGEGWVGFESAQFPPHAQSSLAKVRKGKWRLLPLLVGFFNFSSRSKLLVVGATNGVLRVVRFNLL